MLSRDSNCEGYPNVGPIMAYVQANPVGNVNTPIYCCYSLSWKDQFTTRYISECSNPPDYQLGGISGYICD